MKFTVKSFVALCTTSLTLLLMSTKSNATVNIKILSQVVKSCQKDVISDVYYQKAGLNFNQLSKNAVGSILESCIQNRYHYSLVLYQFPWLNSAGEIIPGYPASVVIEKLVTDQYNIGLVDCFASHDRDPYSNECQRITNEIAGDYKLTDSNMYQSYLIYVCPSCVVAYNDVSGSRKEIFQAFIQWFLRIDKPHRRELISILGDDSKAVQLRNLLMNESSEAVQKYREIRAKVEQQEKERRRRELLGN